MPKKANSKAIVGEVKNLAVVATGFVIGSMGGSAIDRALKVDSAIPGINAKRFVKPAVQLGTGILGATKLKNSDMKLLASGVGASGVVSAVQIATKKNLLAGAPALSGSDLSVYEPLTAFPELPAFTDSDGDLPMDVMQPEAIVEEEFEIL
jgi:hypothetical protein